MTTDVEYSPRRLKLDNVLENVRDHPQVATARHDQGVVTVSYNQAVNPWVHALLGEMRIGEAIEDIEQSADWVRPANLRKEAIE